MPLTPRNNDLVRNDGDGNSGSSSLEPGSFQTGEKSSTTGPETSTKNGKSELLKRTWKNCKRPGSALVARHIAQPILAKTSIALLSASLQNPTPTTVDFSMRITLTLPISFPVLLEPMVVRLCRNYHRNNDQTSRTEAKESEAEAETEAQIEAQIEESGDNSFLEVTVPECVIKRSTHIEVSGETTNVLNMERFGKFINDVMFNKSVMLGVNGSAKAQFRGIKSRLQMNDHVEVIGFNSFPGYAIKSCQLLLPKASDGAHFEALLDLPNPSQATIEMGDLTMNLYIGPITIGEAFIPNVTFTPGPNTISCRVYLDTKTAMANIIPIVQSQKELLLHGKLGVRVSGKSTIRNGENIAYFENALSKLQLYSIVPLSGILGNTVGELATSVAPGNVLSLLRLTGVMAILQGNGVDLARLIQLERPG